MSFVVTVRFVSRPDSGQPEPFYIESGAEWSTLKLMVRATSASGSVQPDWNILLWYKAVFFYSSLFSQRNA